MEVLSLEKADIDAEYDRLKFGHGYSFLLCDEARLTDADVAIVGLNPGGREDFDGYQKNWATSGNAYFDERWADNDTKYSPLQTQIHIWHDLAGVKFDQSLCAQFVPFRSQDWAKLHDGKSRKEEALAFSRRLWRSVLEVSAATKFITMGKVAGVEIASLVEAKFDRSLPTGWGGSKMDVYLAKDGRRVIAMPHPSRYRIFGREQGLSDVAVKSFREALA